jgi:hypothetical protein
MKTWQRAIVGLLVALAISAALGSPARADNKHELLVKKVQTEVAVGTATILGRTGRILGNVEEDFGRTFPLPGP